MFNQEVQKLKTWWPQRVKFFNDELNKLNIDTTADKGTGDGNPPQTVTYTLQVARSASVCTVSVKVGSNAAQTNPTGQLTAAANTNITMTATAAANYTFANWTASSGSLPSGVTATSPTITFSISANVNLTANFTASGVVPPGGENYTLQVGRQTETRGNVSVTVGTNAPQTNPTNSIRVPPNTSVTLTATPNEGCTFVNWTAATGSQLPAGITATSPSITFAMSANTNITANFLRGGTTNYTLTVTSNPETGGSVSINNQSTATATVATWESVTVSASASAGYQFREWTAAAGTSLPSGVDKNSATITFSMSGNLTIAANFQVYTGGGTRTDTVKVEAEDLTSPALGACNSNNNNNPMCVGTNTSNGVTNIGWINNGDNATYQVGVTSQGMYTMVFRIASNVNATFEVFVNNVSYGTISGNTGDWDGYTDVTLPYLDVPFDAGQNTVRLNFRSSVNVDYFLIIGGEVVVGVKYSAPKSVSPARHAVTLKASPNGFTAALPANHGYTSYKLIDMRGRSIRSGKVGPGMTDLRFDGLKRSVMFLKLEGVKGSKPLVLRAVTY
jgi:uncharacterized repeat protein (TIGR02543 family)